MEKTGLCERKPSYRRVLALDGPWEGSQSREGQGRGQGANLLQLPCLLGIRYLLTHPEPLVHPKYTPAKKVTMETTVGSGSLPDVQTHWEGTALLRLFPKSICPAAALLEQRAAPSPALPPVGKLGPAGTEPAYVQVCLGLLRWLNIEN